MNTVDLIENGVKAKEINHLTLMRLNEHSAVGKQASRFRVPPVRHFGRGIGP
jgi:hypothetical protein